VSWASRHAPARSYFIPAAWCKVLPGEQLANELRSALQGARSPKGMLLSGEDGLRMRLVHDGLRQDTSELWLRLRLSPTAARQFNDELRALFDRWREQSTSRGGHYLVHGACAKVG
jgi:hypothetical protein